VVSFVVKLSLAAAMALLFGGAALGVNLGGVQTHPISSCRDDEHTYAIANENTLNGIAKHSRASWWSVPIQSQIALPDILYSSQGCVWHNQAVGGLANAVVMQESLRSTGKESNSRVVVLRRAVRASRRHAHRTATHAHANTRAASVSARRRASVAPVVRLRKSTISLPAVGPGNAFPYGVCTWYADERYHQLHGIYVPWHSNANAWQWTARAYEYGWHVSRVPRVGSIMVLQGGVQGASWLGHVGVVERVLGNGRVIASSMNWGSYPGGVTSWSFSNGPGVTFVSQ
jgi:surface antigen